jgi:hypothetical protein
MALALRRPAAPLPRSRPLVLYCRPPGDFAVQDNQTARLRRELGSSVEVETTSPSDAAQRCRTWVSATQPTLLVLRGGKVVAMAVGCLSLRELEHLIAHSLG